MKKYLTPTKAEKPLNFRPEALNCLTSTFADAYRLTALSSHCDSGNGLLVEEANFWVA